MKSSLDKQNIIKNAKIMEVVRNNDLVYLNYIVNNKESYTKIKTQINYLDNSGNYFSKEYELNTEEIQKGEELSKLIINNYIMTNSNLTEVEKIIFALKYQIFTKYTTLFAEVELSNKIPNKMKLKIIGDMENNVIKFKKQSNYNAGNNFLNCYLSKSIMNRRANLHMHDDDSDDEDDEDDDWDTYDNNIDNKNSNNNQLMSHKSEYNNNDKDKVKDEEKIAEKEKKEEKIEIIPKIKDLNEKETLMKMINTQEFIEGYWEENEYTKIIKDKYQNVYNSLKQLKIKNINEKIIMTILVIFYINKEQQKYLDELIMIIKKAKIFILKEANESYENIVKKINNN